MIDLSLQHCVDLLNGQKGPIGLIADFNKCTSSFILLAVYSIGNLIALILILVILLVVLVMMLVGMYHGTVRGWTWLKLFFLSLVVSKRSQPYHSYDDDKIVNDVTKSGINDDVPIKYPSQDKLGFGPLAQSVALCIRNLQNPVGCVIAIRGPWGSGKSSVVNLTLHSLKNLADDGKDSSPTIIEFSSWSYRTEEGIVSGFFQELYSGLETTLSRSRKAKMAFNKISFSAQNSDGNNTISSISNTISGSMIGSILLTSLWVIQSAWNIIGAFFFGERKQKSMQDIVNKELLKCKRPLLFVIDDIDRLSSREALSIFRVVKSVGRLNNVIYLLSYDQHRVEKLIDGENSSEESRYLEKIVQASFDVPKPSRGDLVMMMKHNLDKLFYEAEDIASYRLESIVHKIVFPEIKTPRDVYRLTNMLSVTYASVKGKVNVADFLGIESLRLFRPSVYQSLRENRDLLVGAREFASIRYENKDLERYKLMFLGSISAEEETRITAALTELFPVLYRILRNGDYNYNEIWETENRVCTDSNFDKYFGLFNISKSVTQGQVRAVANSASNKEYIEDIFQKAAETFDANGRSMASFLLEELEYYGSIVERDNVVPLVHNLLSVSGDLDINSDEVKGAVFSENNRDRLLRSVKGILYSKYNPRESYTIIMSACDYASLEFSVYVYEKCCNERDIYSEVRIVPDADLEKFKEKICYNINNAIEQGTLLSCNDPLYILCKFCIMMTDTPGVAEGVVRDMLNCESNVIKLCDEFCKKFQHIDRTEDDEMTNRIMRNSQLVEIYKMLDEFDFSDTLHSISCKYKDDYEGKVALSTISIWNRVMESIKLI